MLSDRSRKEARETLRAVLADAIEDELITRNPAAVIRLSGTCSKKRRSWSVEEARRFLESACHDEEPLYAAYDLVLVLGPFGGYP